MRSNQTLRFFRYLIRSSIDLTNKEKVVLLRRLRKATLEKIGEKYMISESRIRQIEKAAITKMKSNTHQLTLFNPHVKH